MCKNKFTRQFVDNLLRKSNIYRVDYLIGLRDAFATLKSYGMLGSIMNGVIDELNDQIRNEDMDLMIMAMSGFKKTDEMV